MTTGNGVSNRSFQHLNAGDIVEVRPDIYDRDWTKAEVLSFTYTDIPMHGGGTHRRYELRVRILSRRNYEPLILSERDVRGPIDG